MQPPGGGITAETGRYVCFFLDFDRISRMKVGKYQSESHLQCPKPEGWACKKPKNLKMIETVLINCLGVLTGEGGVAEVHVGGVKPQGPSQKESEPKAQSYQNIAT